MIVCVIDYYGTFPLQPGTGTTGVTIGYSTISEDEEERTKAKCCNYKYLKSANVLFNSIEYFYHSTNEDGSLVFYPEDETNPLTIKAMRDGEYKQLRVTTANLVGGKQRLNICGEEKYDDETEPCDITPYFTEPINPSEHRDASEFRGISSDEKPNGVPKYSIYLELDTGKFYYYTGSSWEIIPKGE